MVATLSKTQTELGQVELPTCSSRGGERAYGALSVPCSFISSIEQQPAVGSSRCVVTLTDGSAFVVNLPFKEVVIALSDAFIEKAELQETYL